MGGEGTHGSAYYENLGITKGMLSWDDCLELAGYLDEALIYALQWPTRGEAEADGWTATVDYATGMGTHHVRGRTRSRGRSTRSLRFLQHDGNGPDAKLVGMSWYVNSGPDAPPWASPGTTTGGTPTSTCASPTRPVWSSATVECGPNQDGNTVYLGNYWMVHTWIVPGWLHAPDIFVGHHPCLLPGGPASPHDACWHMEGGNMEHAA